MTHLMQANQSETVHITDGEPKARCGRTIRFNTLSESMALDVRGSGLKECPKCGTHAEFEQVSDSIAKAEKARREAHLKQMEDIKRRQEMRAEIRLRLTEEIARRLAGMVDNLAFEQWAVATDGKGTITADGETFDIKIKLGSLVV